MRRLNRLLRVYVVMLVVRLYELERNGIMYILAGQFKIDKRAYWIR